jgi:hypothetical protein
MVSTLNYDADRIFTDKETRRRGDKEKGRQGDTASNPALLVSLSPCLDLPSDPVSVYVNETVTVLSSV